MLEYSGVDPSHVFQARPPGNILLCGPRDYYIFNLKRTLFLSLTLQCDPIKIDADTCMHLINVDAFGRLNQSSFTCSADEGQQARNSCPELHIFFLLASHGLIPSWVFVIYSCRPTGAGRHGASSSWERSERSSGDQMTSPPHHLLPLTTTSFLPHSVSFISVNRTLTHVQIPHFPCVYSVVYTIFSKDCLYHQ